MTGPGHHGPEAEDPEAQARRLQEELEAARRAGSAPPYETLAALAAGLGDLRGKVRYLDAVVDRAGLALAKDIRARVGRLTAEVDALGARVQDMEDQVADAGRKGVPRPGTQLVRHGPGRAGRRAGQAVRVGGPRPGPGLPAWPPGPGSAVLAGPLARHLGTGRPVGRVAPRLRPQSARTGGRAGAGGPLGSPAPWSASAASWPSAPTASASWP